MFSHIRLIPLLVIVAGLSFSVRVGDFVSGFQNMGTAFAQQEEVMLDDGHGEGADMGDAKSGSDEQMPTFSNDSAGEAVDWKDAGEEEFEYSEVRAELYRDLSNRRKELDERSKKIMTREALLKAAERELEQKLRELNSVKGEIEALLQEQSEEELARTESLVKIYEGMKAKDAARIFNTLDMGVLLTVMSRMSERKSAPILAEMSSERARSVTILLSQQKRLPSLSSQ